MRTRTAAALTAASFLLALTGCGYSADDCAAALTDASTQTNRPTECQDISDEDYETLLLGRILEKEGLGNLEENPEDLEEYAEDLLQPDLTDAEDDTLEELETPAP